MSEVLSQRCPAKINLTLSVGGPQPPKGYHPICSWMVCVSLYDELWIEPCDEPSRYTIQWADHAPQPSEIDWPVEKDLIFKAHRLVEQRLGRSLPIRARLFKRIPVGAGMGGGSSDAAGMLKALNQLFNLRLPHETLVELAMQLGSDVAFFLGEPSAIVSGFGEQLAPAPLQQRLHMTLILPPLHCNTASVYRKFDEMRPDAKVLAITPERKAEHVLLNDLADAACAVEPRLSELRRDCALISGKSAHVTGSGAAMFILQPDDAAAATLATRLIEKCLVPSLPAHTL